jgi:hypothetical protein
MGFETILDGVAADVATISLNRPVTNGPERRPVRDRGR